MGVPTAATIPSRRERNAGDETDNCESRQAATDKSFALVLCPSSEFSICAWTEQENVRNDVGEVAACFDEGSRGSSDLRRSRTSLNPRPGVSLLIVTNVFVRNVVPHSRPVTHDENSRAFLSEIRALPFPGVFCFHRSGIHHPD